MSSEQRPEHHSVLPLYTSENPVLAHRYHLLWCIQNISKDLQAQDLVISTANPEVLNGLVDKLGKITEIAGIITHRRTLIEPVKASAKDVEILKKFGVIEKDWGLVKPAEVPFEDLDERKMITITKALHQIGGTMGNVTMSIGTAKRHPGIEKLDRRYKRSLHSIITTTRKTQAALSGEILPPVQEPIELIDLHMDILDQVDVFNQFDGELKLISEQKEILDEHEETTFTGDPTDMPILVYNILQNTLRAYNKRDRLFKDTERANEPRVIEVLYLLTDHEVRVIFRDRATGYNPQLNIIEAGFQQGVSDTAEVEGVSVSEHGMGMSDLADRGIVMIPDNYQYDPNDPTKTGASLTVIFQRNTA